MEAQIYRLSTDGVRSDVLDQLAGLSKDLSDRVYSIVSSVCEEPTLPPAGPHKVATFAYETMVRLSSDMGLVAASIASEIVQKASSDGRRLRPFRLVLVPPSGAALQGKVPDQDEDLRLLCQAYVDEAPTIEPVE